MYHLCISLLYLCTRLEHFCITLYTRYIIAELLETEREYVKKLEGGINVSTWDGHHVTIS